VWEHGLPAHDTLTIWGSGAEWVDQQWLAQLTFFGLASAGGVKLALLANAALVGGAVVLAAAVARLRGASPRSVLPFVVAFVFVAPWALQMRPQSFAYPLFAGVLALAAADARRPSRRVWLVLPLLVVWANVHGSVLLGALLVMLLAALGLVRRRGAVRNAALLVLAPLCVLASPYGTSLVGYYGKLLDPAFARYVVEWQPSRPAIVTAPFYVLAAAAIWLLMRRARRLSAYDRIVLLVLLAAGFAAVRNIVWFAFAALMLLPLAFEDAFPRRSGAPSRARLDVALAAISAGAVLLGVVLAATRPSGWLEAQWKPGPASAVAAALSADPSTRVFAGDRHADWLLWKVPAAAGNVAYDSRFELLPEQRLSQLLAAAETRGPLWRRPLRDFDLLVLSSKSDAARALLADPRYRPLYLDERSLVLVRS
jgi:hypothetical protein